MRRRFLLVMLLVIVGLAGVGAWSNVWAAPPWENFLTRNRVEADPDKDYGLSKDDGPWMIMASSFSGDGAEEQARALALELRKRYKLEAFVHEMEFKLGETGGRGIDKYGDPLKWKYRRGAEVREMAVLVGDYAAVDDPEAIATLRKIKYSQPDCLQVGKDKKTNQSLGALRDVQKAIWEAAGSDDKKDKGPMGHAFITPNPLLSRDEYVPKGLDPLVAKMNKGLENSLLDCPGKYTVQVATFRGKIVTKQSEIAMIQNGEKKVDGSRLEEAAAKADRLAKALRLKGWEAYVFHERCASIVTVGSFNSVGMNRQDGKIEIDSRIHNIIKTFKAKNVDGRFSPQTLVGIPFDVQPRPVQVPKQAIGVARSSSAGGLW